MVTRTQRRPRLVVRRHGIVLAGPLVRSAALSAMGFAAVLVGWPATPVGAVALALGASVALRAVWRWERTRIVVSRGELAVVDGTLRRRRAAVPLTQLGTLEVDQSFVGRLLGYGTVVAGDLEIRYVARPRELVSILR